jgi:hypothetical protein
MPAVNNILSISLCLQTWAKFCLGMLYAGCHMPRLVCRFLYVECHVLAVASLQSDQLYAYFSTSFHMLYVRSHMPVTVYLHLYAGTWVPSSSLWVTKLAYMSNCCISVHMPSALFQELCTEGYGLYAKLHMLDCNMPNAMTIAMSFRMTTEQVGYFIIYMSITRLWLSILPLRRRNYYYTTRASVYISKSQVFQYAGISWQRAKC